MIRPLAAALAPWVLPPWVSAGVVGGVWGCLPAPLSAAAVLCSPRTSSRWRVPADVPSGGASCPPQAGSDLTWFHRRRRKQPGVVFKAAGFSPHVWGGRGGRLLDLGRARPPLSSVGSFFLSSLLRDLLSSALVLRPECDPGRLLSSAEF